MEPPYTGTGPEWPRCGQTAAAGLCAAAWKRMGEEKAGAPRANRLRRPWGGCPREAMP
ncbi:MAG: hypothetical protein IJM26_00055 [Lachnospiraceae bacterium]|nr:hypothetical protein [Lachnospiraceae bacterium]